MEKFGLADFKVISDQDLDLELKIADRKKKPDIFFRTIRKILCDI